MSAREIAERMVNEEYDRLMATGKWVTSEAIAAKVAVRTGMIHPHFDIAEGYLLSDKDDMTQPLCTVNGRQVQELAVLVKPVSLFVTTDSGNHEITRMFFHGGKFLYGSGLERLGGIGTESVEYKPAEGMYIHLERGYEMFIPESHCQATWKLPG